MHPQTAEAYVIFASAEPDPTRHPLSEDARIKLTVRFGEDYGTDRNRWRTRIAQELKGR